MTRLIYKFNRFTHIMATNPYHVVVPTLDVDLAWVSVHRAQSFWWLGELMVTITAHVPADAVGLLRENDSGDRQIH